MTAPDASLRRAIGIGGAVSIGLAAMVGAGVFTVWGSATEAAGSLLLVGLAIAALVAVANALSTTQLAIRYPEAGGAYVYGRRRLGEWWGFVAGWSFVVGKTASCAAMALAIAAAIAPDGWERPVAAGIALLVGLLAAGGVTRTARAALVVVVAVLSVLSVLVVSALVMLPPVEPLEIAAGASRETAVVVGGLPEASVLGVLQAAGLLFFAFAGYARMATLGEEVRDPRRTLLRAVPIALGTALLVYTGVGWALQSRLGGGAVASSDAPLVDLAAALSSPALVVAVSVAAVLAAGGALLALLAGLGRTSLAMAREGDLPSPLARISARSGAPAAAQLTAAVLVAAIVCIADVRTAIGFSSFGVLLYYFVANLAAVTQPRDDRIMLRAVSVFGMAGTLVLAFSLPLVSVLGGVAVVAAGVLIRIIRLRRSPKVQPEETASS